MKVVFDEQEFELSESLESALIQVMNAMCNMMRKVEPDNAKCWTWGRCEVSDLCNTAPFNFTYGGDEDMPEDMKFQFKVVGM